ncbi:MAG TPA: SprT-like domain-containing protein [Chitinophagaceae bacterium]|nr:SprT-like domain-containing protein [Chitinophagaceae bacterium]
MPKQEVPLQQLSNYLPPGTYEPVIAFLEKYKVHLTVSRERKSILGDYRHRTHHENHRISVNGNLNIYAFLITLVHELAHLLTYEVHGNKVMAHGKEWKKIYASLLNEFLQNKTFPPPIEKELIRSYENPSASTCAEDGLLRELRKFDPKKSDLRLLEELPADALFKIHDGRIFQRGKQLRKRFQCKEVKTGRVYLFSPVHEVELITDSG